MYSIWLTRKPISPVTVMNALPNDSALRTELVRGGIEALRRDRELRVTAQRLAELHTTNGELLLEEERTGVAEQRAGLRRQADDELGNGCEPALLPPICASGA